MDLGLGILNDGFFCFTSLLRAFEYPIRLRWGKSSQEGVGGELGVPPSKIRV